jgi:hypothetical protein
MRFARLPGGAMTSNPETVRPREGTEKDVKKQAEAVR